MDMFYDAEISFWRRLLFLVTAVVTNFILAWLIKMLFSFEIELEDFHGYSKSKM
jgi:hypothetical protein